MFIRSRWLRLNILSEPRGCPLSPSLRKIPPRSFVIQINLVRLAKEAGFTLNDQQKDLLAEITTFNIKARYDDYKTNFYKKATRTYTQGYINETKNLIIWLKKNYPNLS